MALLDLPSSWLAKIGQDVAQSLAGSSVISAGLLIRTPMLYPSGTSVVIRIDGAQNRFFISDFGTGFEEAMMLSASASYSSIARKISEGTGISFDSRSFFVAEAHRDELVPVVAAVANFSQRAVIETAVKHEAKRLDRERGMLIDRLDHVFGKDRVEKDIAIRGASKTEWEVTAAVPAKGNIISLFEYAKPHKNSVSNIVTKFHDIGLLAEAPRRFVSVNSSDEMGNFMGLLSQTASVINLFLTPDEALRRLAA